MDQAKEPEKPKVDETIPQSVPITIPAEMVKSEEEYDDPTDTSYHIEKGGYFKWTLLLFTMFAFSISVYFVIVMTSREWEFYHILYAPTVLTTFVAVVALLGYFNKIRSKKIIFAAFFSLLINLVSLIFILIQPGIFSSDMLSLVILFNLEPPYFVPVFIFNIFIVVALWFWKPKQKIELPVA